jgi:hypothetical protein
MRTPLFLSLVLVAAPTTSSPDVSGGLTRSFSAALVSGARSPDIPARDDIYAPLEGTWEVETRDVMEDGSVVSGHGEWLFARVLEGRAFQDVWILPARLPAGGRPGHPRNRYGTSLRTLDPLTHRWQVTWFNPVSGAFDVLHARKEGERIIQEGRRPDGQRIRWVFDLLTADRFHWYGEAEQADGSWTREAEFWGRRRAAAGG